VRAGRGLLEATPAEAARLSIATTRARIGLDRVRELDPNWRPTPSLAETVEGEIRAREGEAEEAEARYREIVRDAIPGANPSWGVNRLRKELNDRGYQFVEPTDSPGYLYRNPQTEEEVRIMERPAGRPSRTDPKQKLHNDFYYRYRPGPRRQEGSHITIPNKPLQSKSVTEDCHERFI